MKKNQLMLTWLLMFLLCILSVYEFTSDSAQSGVAILSVAAGIYFFSFLFNQFSSRESKVGFLFYTNPKAPMYIATFLVVVMIFYGRVNSSINFDSAYGLAAIGFFLGLLTKFLVPDIILKSVKKILKED